MTPATFHTVGQAIPDIPHAISVSLPSWKANVGYEEGEDWVLSKMRNGYPRFFIHLTIQAFAKAIVERYGEDDEEAMLFPSPPVSDRCVDFIRTRSMSSSENGHLSDNRYGRVLNLVVQKSSVSSHSSQDPVTAVSAVLYPKLLSSTARKFWQHTGDGISSRRAEFFYKAFQEGHLVSQESVGAAESSTTVFQKGPRRYQRGGPLNGIHRATTTSDGGYLFSQRQSVLENADYVQFVEERFGRNLDMSLAANAKKAIRRRIAGSLTADVELEEALDISDRATPMRTTNDFSAEDVYLYPTGMSAIYNSHRMLLETRGQLRSVDFGFPYIDTLKVLENFGPGCLFYGHGSSEELDDLEKRCRQGEKFLALYCEFPGNPLLKTPDLQRIRDMANIYDFAVVVDETIGNFLNINVLPAADIVVSSLTKLFSGDSNVMGGSLILNPTGRYYQQLREALGNDYDDLYWPEDAVYMERNSRDFVARNAKINSNAEALSQLLKESPYIKEVNYPKLSPSRPNFEAFRNVGGGYGGLLSLTFQSMQDAVIFFDALETAKGPSLGTNFTLCCPFVILAHYNELDWAAQYGAEAGLVRLSVGLENTDELLAVFRRALTAIARSRGSP